MQNVVELENLITKIDYNFDLAQSFGVYENDSQYSFLDYVSSVNVSAGFHAGDPVSIRKTMLACAEKNVSIGVHIGFDDFKGFGNRALKLNDDELEAIVIYQIGAISSFAKTYGLKIEHVRPHGAMYKMASEDFQFSAKIAKAIQKFDEWLIYVGASGEVLEKVSNALSIRVAHEVFLTKIYNQNGTINHNMPDFVDMRRSNERLKKIIETSQIDTQEGETAKIKADTVHFSNNAVNSLMIMKEANELIIPTPLNYNRVSESGWIE